MRLSRRSKVDVSKESLILTGLIVSDKICASLLPFVDPIYFQVEYIQDVVKWVKDFYNSYKSAPGLHLRNIFDSQKAKIDEDKANLISEFLARLSEKYEDNKSINEGYVIDEGKKYIKARAIAHKANNAMRLVEAGRIDQAEAEITAYKGVSKSTSSWFNPFNFQDINKAMDYESAKVLSFPGKLGELIGDLERGYLLAVLGPAKRTKTWWLLEMAMLGILQRKRVMLFSLEMNANRIMRRIFQRLLSTTPSSEESFIAYPCFDCESNQKGECRRSERTNKITLVDNEGMLPEYTPFMKYQPCTYCRDNSIDGYVPATWYTTLKRPGFNLKSVRKHILSFNKQFGGLWNFRGKSYPRFSASISDLKRDADILESIEGFVPDIVIVDYEGILRSDLGRGEERDKVNDTWMKLAGWAEERNCLVVTATQAGKWSWSKTNVESHDTSEDYRKNANVDVMLSISQTREEKNTGRARIAVVEHRDRFFDESRHVTVLQQIGAGQPFLDSEFCESKDSDT